MAACHSANLRLQKILLDANKQKESMFAIERLEAAPADPILDLTTAFNADTFAKKVNLGVGAYRTDEGKPWILPVVRKVEQDMMNDPSVDHEYIPIDGTKAFTEAASKLILGQGSVALRENRVCCLQTLSGSGALRLTSEFLINFFPERTIYYCNPSWPIHKVIFHYAGLKSATYRYFNAATNGLDYDGMMADLSTMPPGSFVLLHVCAHNPTGVDPTQEQWIEIAKVMKSRQLFPFFDCAYQGFATGDLDRDAFAVRHFVEEGFSLFVAQSFAKNFGLYGERVGALTFVGTSPLAATRALGQLKRLQRAMVSSPPSYGARIVTRILTNPVYYEEWKQALAVMSGRICQMREKLHAALTARATPGNWQHVLDQIGMFTYTGLRAEQVKMLTENYHIYLTADGRISMPGLNTRNVEYVADAIHTVVVGK